VTSLFALFLLLSLGLSAAVVFSPPHARGKLKALLAACLLLAWVFLGVALVQIVARTASTLVAPRESRRPQVLESAAREALTLVSALGGPALLVTALAWFSHRATRVPQETGAQRRSVKRARLAQVRGPGKDLDEARALFEEYARSLDFDLGFQNFAQEVATLPGEYAPPRGRLLLARVGKTAAGCVALHGLDGGTAEMKRLYVRPQFRKAGIGRALAQAVLTEAKKLGYTRIRLDTVPAMGEATALYRSLGFFEIPSYRENPVPGALFLERTLT
jgi:ribosomal protein S18 acetylase RimI-like enzyme